MDVLRNKEINDLLTKPIKIPRKRAGVIVEPKRTAPTPAANGVAIEVPVFKVNALMPEIDAHLTSTPGAIKSTPAPKLLKYEAKALFKSDAATVIADGSLAGEKLATSAAELPAATNTAAFVLA